MEKEKNTFIVILQMLTIENDELMRIKGVIRSLTNKEPLAISDKKNTVMYFVHAVYEDLHKELDLVRAPGTSLFIARLSEPCTTIGFSSLRAALQAYGLGQDQRHKKQ